jgi:hypothetical protein
MFDGEDGLAVMRVQSALLDLGREIGAKGADGVFGPDTGRAVIEYKTDKHLVPNDPVVGSATTQALDDDLFHDPPTLDPTFAEFTPAVIDHRLEQFIALELVALLHAPLDSSRHMLGLFALNALNSGELLGIVAQSRAVDLRDPFLAVADPVQPDEVSSPPKTAEDFFDDAIISGDAVGVTVTFFVGGQPRAFIVVRDDVVLGRGSILRTSDGTRAPAPLQGVVVHELFHARNLVNIQALLATADGDTDAYADTALAQARSATGRATARVLRSFVAELSARHMHWIVLKELAGTPGGIAVRGLKPKNLARAAIFYFTELGPTLFDSNGYGAGINAQRDAVRFQQLALWLHICANQSFSDVPGEEQSQLAFQAAAQFCADEVANGTLEFDEEDGVFPLIKNFH